MKRKIDIANLTQRMDSHKTSQLILIRHGHSQFLEYRYLNAENEEKYPYSRFMPMLIDPFLSGRGSHEAISGQETSKSLKPQIIFVSPLRRALETAHKLFSEFPGRVKAIVHPLLIELLGNANDIPKDIELDNRRFVESLPGSHHLEFDFSLMQNSQKADELKKKHELKCKSSLLIPYLEIGKKTREKIISAILAHENTGNISLPIHEIIRQFGSAKGARLESWKSLRKRVEKFKSILIKELQEGKLEPNQDIVVISHSQWLKLFQHPDCPEGKVSTPKSLRPLEMKLFKFAY